MIEHVITKKIGKGQFRAWFQFKEPVPFADKLTLKFGIWGVPVTFDLEEIIEKQDGTFRMVVVNSSSATLKSFRKVKALWIRNIPGKEKSEKLLTEKVKNSGMFEDLTDVRTFANAKRKLEKALN
ncbi:hypothetical protein [Jiulongibacter sp. NS-SX5]|uniref:hypothetical protein n=1 Tax=Jiulongibacter sp. NS-SX5 TaxID=3463854 RepID=UPI004059A925